jgi:hypothetical protein
VWVNTHQKAKKSALLPEELVARVKEREGGRFVPNILQK